MKYAIAISAADKTSHGDQAKIITDTAIKI